MRFSTLFMATLLSLGAVGVAQATPTNLIQNGDFSQNSSPNGTIPTQFGGTVRSGHDANGACNYGGDFINDWVGSGNGSYAIWYPSAAAASGVTACNKYNGNTSQRLPSTVVAPPMGTSFVGLDGQPGLNGSIQQTLSGLTTGAKYTVSFYWASTQEMSRTGPTTEKFQVSLGGQSFDTGVNSIGTQGWSGWAQQSFTFTADATSSALKFLSIGTPNGEPPFALLSGVSMTQDVPEPPVLAMFGGGLLGLGLLTVFARRREMRRRDANGNSALV